MRRTAALCVSAALVLAALRAAPADAPGSSSVRPSASAAQALPRCVEKPPCVYVLPDPELVPEGTLLIYHGQGWRPRGRVEAHFDSYCPPAKGIEEGVCAGVGRWKRFRADAAGRFEFRFVQAPRLPNGIAPPAAAGSGPLLFEQWTGKPGFSGLIQRDAIPVPRPGTPRDRADARAIRNAIVRLERELQRNGARTLVANLRHERATSRCGDIVNKERPRRVADVIFAVVVLGGDHVRLRLHRPALARYAATLESLEPADPELSAGATAWMEQIRKPRYVPKPSVCAVLRRWKRTGYAASAAPVDPRAHDMEGDVGGDARIGTSVRRLRELGVGHRAATLFGGHVLDYSILAGEP